MKDRKEVNSKGEDMDDLENIFEGVKIDNMHSSKQGIHLGKSMRDSVTSSLVRTLLLLSILVLLVAPICFSSYYYFTSTSFISSSLLF